MRLVILAHERFPDRAKTAVGVLRYSNHDVVAVLDRESEFNRVNEVLPDVQDAPIVESMADAPNADALLIGIAPIGGGLDNSWRTDIHRALQSKCDIISGLHYFLQDDEELAQMAAEYGCELRDVRRPHDDIGVSKGIADQVDAEVVLTVGTDCSVGKMTASLELLAAAKEQGVDACFIPTGQTGIMISGWGNPVDRVVSDFTAGSVEELILEVGDDHDYLIVEGQGSIIHPAYSAVTCGILHGSMPDKLVLCHEAGRDVIHGYEDTELPPISTYIDLYEQLAKPVHDTAVVAGALNTSGLDTETGARQAIETYEEALGLPATDPVRFDAAKVLEEIL